MWPRNFQYGCYAINGLISTIACLVSISIFAYSPLFRKPPGYLIFWQLIWECALSVLWVFEGFGQFDLTYGQCDKIGPFLLLMWISSCCYSFLLNLEIFIRLKNPLNVSYNKRGYVYHIVTTILSLLGLAWAFVWPYIVGQSDILNCFIEWDTWFGFVVNILDIWRRAFCIILTITVFYYRANLSKKFFWRFAIFTFTADVMDIPRSIYRYYQDPDLNNVAAFVESIQGFAMWAVIITVRVVYYKQAANREALLDRATKGSIFNIFNEVYAEYIQHIIVWLKETFIQEKRARDKSGNLFIQQVYDSSFTENRTIRIEKDEFSGLLFSNGVPISQILVEITQHAPAVFENLRQKDNIDLSVMIQSMQLNQEKARSFSIDSSNSKGKSNALVYFTHDFRFIVKTLTNEEHKFFLQKMLSPYHHHVVNTENKSLLARIYGLFTIDFKERQSAKVAIFQNVSVVNALLRFDLKGSTKGRQEADNDTECRTELHSNTLYKDNDFTKILETIQIAYDAHDMVQILDADSRFLQQMNVMDYSLLLTMIDLVDDSASKLERHMWLGEHEIYAAGIIDFFQQFTTKKRLENMGRRFTAKHNEISAVHPKRYQERFMNFIHQIVQTTEL